MSQINVNPSREPVDVVDTSGDRSAAAGINLVTVLIVLAVLAVIAWYLFTGPLRVGSSGSSTNINVNPPSQPTTTINVNPPSQPNAPAPAPANNNPAPANNNPAPGGNNTGGGGGGTGTNP